MVTPMINEELVEHIRGGDADSIEKLLQSNQEYLYKLARHLSNNPDVIEDLVQEGTITILDAACSYNPAQGVMVSYLRHTVYPQSDAQFHGKDFLADGDTYGKV